METLEITVTTRREAEKLAEELKKKPQVKAVEGCSTRPKRQRKLTQ